MLFGDFAFADDAGFVEGEELALGVEDVKEVAEAGVVFVAGDLVGGLCGLDAKAELAEAFLFLLAAGESVADVGEGGEDGVLVVGKGGFLLLGLDVDVGDDLAAVEDGEGDAGADAVDVAVPVDEVADVEGVEAEVAGDVDGGVALGLGGAEGVGGGLEAALDGVDVGAAADGVGGDAVFEVKALGGGDGGGAEAGGLAAGAVFLALLGFLGGALHEVGVFDDLGGEGAGGDAAEEGDGVLGGGDLGLEGGDGGGGGAEVVFGLVFFELVGEAAGVAVGLEVVVVLLEAEVVLGDHEAALEGAELDVVGGEVGGDGDPHGLEVGLGSLCLGLGGADEVGVFAEEVKLPAGGGVEVVVGVAVVAGAAVVGGAVARGVAAEIDLGPERALLVTPGGAGGGEVGAGGLEGAVGGVGLGEEPVKGLVAEGAPPGVELGGGGLGEEAGEGVLTGVLGDGGGLKDV